jgi:hypothetical protein
MNGIIDAYGKEKEIHVILDNLKYSQTQERSLAQRPSQRASSLYANSHFTAYSD